MYIYIYIYIYIIEHFSLLLIFGQNMSRKHTISYSCLSRFLIIIMQRELLPCPHQRFFCGKTPNHYGLRFLLIPPSIHSIANLFQIVPLFHEKKPHRQFTLMKTSKKYYS